MEKGSEIEKEAFGAKLKNILERIIKGREG